MSSNTGLSDDERRQREIDNGFRQYDFALEVITDFIGPERAFALRPSLILELQSIAVEGIEAYPGQWRKSNVEISGSKHTPPGPHLVENLVTELCDYINNWWHERTAFHLASYIMWRLNWIHPFNDGNGRTSRILSYIVLCTKLGYILPGSPAIPQQIEADRTRYFHALEAADEALDDTKNYDFSVMEEMLKAMLANQLVSVIEEAHGSPI